MTFSTRLVRFVLALVLMLSLLSACSSDFWEEEADPSAEEAPAAEVVEGESAEAEESAPEEAAPEEAAPEGAAPEGAAPNPTAEPMEEAAPAQSGPKSSDTWLVMLYQDADDEVLEKDIFIDLNEAEMVGSSDQVTIIAQIDRMNGGYDGGGDWHTTKRFLINQDPSGDLETLASEELADLGELDMGSKDTLVDFAVWAIQNYPADKYALILSDHGAGWTGGWSDNDPTPQSQMYLNNIDEALADITTQTGVEQLDLVGFDACLMGQLDVLSAVAPHARYMIGSEETEPSLGWAYASFLSALTENTGMNGGELASKIVDGYITEDGRITDEAARATFISEAFRSPNATLSPEQIAQAMGGDITLTAFDLSKLEPVNAALNELVMVLQDVDQSEVAQARAYTQSYTNIFGKDVQPSFIDLGHFASLLAETFPGTPVADAAGTLLESIPNVIVAEKHGPQRPGSTGVSIYFPNGDLYALTANPDIMAYYPRVSGRFVTASLWDDFLTFHYASSPIDPASADASVIQAQSTASDFTKAIQASALLQGAEITRPGAGEVDFQGLTASAETISVNDTLTLSAELRGKNVGYIYIYTAYYDPESNSYLTTDLDFVGTDKARQVGGVSYPDWGEEEDLSMELTWEPILWTVSDGQTDALAAAEAETYGVTAETTFYRVWGTYRMAGSENEHDAFLRFDANGKLDSVTIFSGPEQNAAPRKIIPAQGDSFTVAQEWLEFDSNPEGEYSYFSGDTVTFGADGFQLVSNEAAAGEYTIGLVVEDLDGKSYEKYIEVTVTE